MKKQVCPLCGHEDGHHRQCRLGSKKNTNLVRQMTQRNRLILKNIQSRKLREQKRKGREKN